MSERVVKAKAMRPSSSNTPREALAPGLPVDRHEEELIDEALTETFPASDPIAVPSSAERRRPRRLR